MRKGGRIAVLGGGGDVANFFYRNAGLFRKARQKGYEIVCIDLKRKSEVPPRLQTAYNGFFRPSDKRLDSMNFNAIIVATPPRHHLAGLKWAIKRGIHHVFIEKPLVAPNQLREFHQILNREMPARGKVRTRIYGIDWVHGSKSFRDACKYMPGIGRIKEITTVLIDHVLPAKRRTEFLDGSRVAGGSNQDMAAHNLFFVFQALASAGIQVSKKDLELLRCEYFKMKGSNKIGPGETAAATELRIKTSKGNVIARSWCGQGLHESNFTYRVVGTHGTITIGLGHPAIGLPPRLVVTKGKKAIVNKAYKPTHAFMDIGYNNVVKDIFASIEGRSRLPIRKERELLRHMGLAVYILHKASLKAVGASYERPMKRYPKGAAIWTSQGFKRATRLRHRKK